MAQTATPQNMRMYLRAGALSYKCLHSYRFTVIILSCRPRTKDIYYIFNLGTKL